MANEIQTITFTGSATGGTWTITFDGQTTAGIAYNANAAAVQAALEALSSIGAGDVAVTGSVGAGFTVEFQGALAGTNVAEMTVSDAGLTIAASTVTAATTVAGVSAANEEQSLAFTVLGLVSGTWSITFDGETTGPLAYNAGAATIQTALEALTNIGAGNISVQGNIGAGLTFEFIGALANTNVPQITASNIDLFQSAAGVNQNTTTNGVDFVAAVAEVFTVADGADSTVQFGDGSTSGSITFIGNLIDSINSTPTGYTLTGGGIGNSSATYTADAAGAAADMSKTGGDGTVTIDTQGSDEVAAVVEVQTISLTGSPEAGTWKPAGTTDVDFDATSAEVEAAIEADLGEAVGVSDDAAYPNITYTVTWDIAGARANLSPGSSGLSKAWTGSFTINTVVAGSAGVAEVQTLTLTDSPTGGTWTANGGAAVAFDVSAASLEANLEGTLGLGVGVVKAGYLYTITWDAVGNRAQVTGNGASLTKGWGGSIDVATDTQGSSGGGMLLLGVG